jgi:phosphoribosylformimino-5-aminoimidazole carboxamide ribotide isomerase
MELFPAIDLRGGHCVRLAEGDFGRETVYDGDPVERALAFEAAGAPWVHVVDLDAARAGEALNRPVVAAIARAVAVPVQSGGGVRSLDDAAALLDECGVARVVIGTAAVEQPALVADIAARWPGRVAVGLDHRNGEVRIRGWAQGGGRQVDEVLAEMAGCGAAAAIVTDIARDGILTGPDLDGLERLLAVAEIDLIASGGVASLEDLTQLASLQRKGRGLAGVIVGRAIYEGRFDVDQAVAASAGALRRTGLGPGEPL